MEKAKHGMDEHANPTLPPSDNSVPGHVPSYTVKFKIPRTDLDPSPATIGALKEDDPEHTGSTQPPLDVVSPGQVPIYTVKLQVGQDTSNQAGPPYLPPSNVVQPSGSSYCPSKGELGTLGVRVDAQPNTGFCYVATYHNFAESQTDFAWAYQPAGSPPTTGQTGTVLRRNYTWGADHKFPLLDCALIQLSSTAQPSVAPGLFQGTGRPSAQIRGTKPAVPGMIVSKFGMTTGFTYGCVIDLPLDMDRKIYGGYLFAVELCDANGYPLPGNFSNPGDSGAPVVDMFGYVLGLIVQGRGALTLVNRFDQIQAALDVTLHAG